MFSGKITVIHNSNVSSYYVLFIGLASVSIGGMSELYSSLLMQAYSYKVEFGALSGK